VTPPKGKGKGSAATSSGAHGGKGVTISTMAKSEAGPHFWHPRAVAIFASNNRGGLFVKGQDAGKRSNVTPPKSNGAGGATDNRRRIAGIQRGLASLGYDPGPADGILGPNTRAAVRAFQAREGLSVTGTVSASFVAALRSASGAVASAASPAPRSLKKTSTGSGFYANVTPPKSNGAGAHGGKGVTINKMAKSEAGPNVRHPRALHIFTSDNRGGLFAKGVKIKDAFKKNAGNDPLSAGTASAPTSGHGPTQVAHGGKGGAKGGGLSGGGLSGGGNGGEARDTLPLPIKGKKL